MPDERLERLAAALAGRYQLERELGQGGMATVYLAQDLRHDRPVALKVLKPEVAAIVGTDRFIREIRVTARLTHPHILPLLDSGDAGGSLFYVMPLVEGDSLRDRLIREKQLPLEDSLRIAREVADALAYAHSHGVIHRDIKPENILLSNGRAVVADFGIARALSVSDAHKLTETGLAIGTPDYMSPEQAAGESQIDGRSDIYSLGCVLYELIVGEPPYTGPTAQVILARRLMEPPARIRSVRETVSEPLERAVLKSLARAPADRYSTAAEFAAALEQSTGQRRRAGSGRRWGIIGAAALLVILAVAAIVRFVPRAATSSVVPSASHIAVLPFTPSGTDTALARLGRDLVFTLSAELDGLGDIRVVDAHTVLSQTSASGLYSPEEAAALAQRFGAGSLVQGSLVRDGAGVRIDFALQPVAAGSAPLARGSVAGALDSIAALTDSAVHVLLAQIWVGGTAPTPSLETALKTRSVPALRAFLEGEQQMARGLWTEAAASYGRAHQSDSTFWLAAARQAFSSTWGLAEPPDSLLFQLQQHRNELPEVERLTTDVIVFWTLDSIARGLETGRKLTQRFPGSWFAWLIYADHLLHNGPILGHSVFEAKDGFERALELNPNLIPAHEHLLLLAIQAQDTAGAAREFAELTRLDAGPALTADGYGTRMLQFRFLLSLIRGDSDMATRFIDSIARDPAPAAAETGTFYDAYLYGFFDQQIRISEQKIRYGDSNVRRGAYRFLYLSWAARGVWDSALAVMDRLTATGLEPLAALRTYGLAVLGNWLGAIPASDLEVRRAAAVASGGGGWAELVWLDGIEAYARRDRLALSKAQAALREIVSPGSESLVRSLAAFDQALAGDSIAAGKALAALEWEEAQVNSPSFVQHPYTIAIDRIAAARWLAAGGDYDQAIRLLTFVEGTYQLHPSEEVNVAMGGVVDRERARIEEARRAED